MSDPAWTTEAPSVAGEYEVRYGQHEDFMQMRVKVIGLSFNGSPICLLPEGEPPRFWGRVWVADPQYAVSASEWRGPLPRPGGTG